MTDKKTKIEFAPGCFDNFDGTQEELDGLVAELDRLAKTGEIHEQSRELTEDEFEKLSKDEQRVIIEALSNLFNDSSTDTRKIQ